MRSIVFLGMTLLAASVGIGQNHPSLPSSFRATTIHSQKGADIFVRSGGRGPVVVLLHGYAENSDSWAPLAADYGYEFRFLPRQQYGEVQWDFCYCD